MSAPLPFTSETEAIPPDEAESLRRVLATLDTTLRRSAAETGKRQPDVHVKSDGCARGQLRVAPDLPAELAQGVFKTPSVFEVLARFSNGARQPQSDWKPDGRGLAIKIKGVEGERLDGDFGSSEQDFIMINHPVFFVRDVQGYAELEEIVASSDGPLTKGAKFLTGGSWNPLQWQWREAITTVQAAGHLPHHPAAITFFSMTPIRFGDFVAKYRVQPAGNAHESFLATVQKLAQEPDALRLMLEETLRNEEVVYNLQVQLRTSEGMPIEDATIEWSEAESPYRTVAQLVFPPQDIGHDAWQTSCNYLVFNVWNALAAHQPLGGINRMRREVYRTSAEWRLAK